MVRILLVALIGSCQIGVAQERPYVILVSFDGFRADYVERFDLPNFRQFIQNGSSAAGLVPCYPSKTFPNHYSIVTGLYPGHHGIVDNHFYDTEMHKTFNLRDSATVHDPSFFGGVPLWQLAREQGLASASFFWVGSEMNDPQRSPDYFFNYDSRIPNEKRIDQVIAWLNLPADRRPHFITLYFSSPDSESHQTGPFGGAVANKLGTLDSLLGVLMMRTRETGLAINVILTSDHGMSELTASESTYLFLPELVGISDDFKVINGGTQLHIYSNSAGSVDSLYHTLRTHSNGFAVWRRQDFPASWNYDHPRAGDIILAAEPGKIIVSASRENFLKNMQAGRRFGAHGYDPAIVPDMTGIFYAQGPNIQKGVRLPEILNIHIYPLIATILGLKHGPIDGDYSVVAPLYQPNK